MDRQHESQHVGFATVFCHELASIRDRRRSQRIEALEQAGKRKDHSPATVWLMVETVQEEAFRAKQAARVAAHGLELTSVAEQAFQAYQTILAASGNAAVEGARDQLQQIRSLAQVAAASMPVSKDWAMKRVEKEAARKTMAGLRALAASKEAAAAPLPEQAAHDETTGAARLGAVAESTAALLMRAADQVAGVFGSVLDMKSAAREATQTINDSAWGFLQTALPGREPRAPEDAEPTLAQVSQMKDQSADAAAKAGAAWDAVKEAARRIEVSFACHAAAEKARKAAAIVALAGASADSDREFTVAVETLPPLAASVQAVTDAANAIKGRRDEPGHDTAETMAAAISRAAADALLSLLAAAQVVAHALQPDPQARFRQSAPALAAALIEAGKACQECAQSRALEHTDREQAVNSLAQFGEALARAGKGLISLADQWREEGPLPANLVEMINEATQTLQASAPLRGQLGGRAAQEPWADADQAARVASASCDHLALAGLALIHPQRVRHETWDAVVATNTLNAAVQTLAQRALEVVKWSWTAESSAANALRLARGILAKRGQPNPQLVMQAARSQALDMDLVGLAFSGGGIRSASFGLGVLQALANLRLLRFFDYFSTVSGGGYIGSWLAAWVRREGSLINVEKQLDPNRVEQARAHRGVKECEEAPAGVDNHDFPLGRNAVDEEPEPINHLRAYSRYLSPRSGLFSADTWTLGAIYLRNLLINQVSILPWALALILLTRLLVWGFAYPGTDAFQFAVAIAFLYSATVIVVWMYQQRTRLNEAAGDPNRFPEGVDRLEAGLGTALYSGVVVILIGMGIHCLSESQWPGRIACLAIAVLIGGLLYFGRERLARRAPPQKAIASGNDGGARQQTATVAGIVLLCSVMLMVVSSLWLFDYTPYTDDPSKTLTEKQANDLGLKLRYPGYELVHQWTFPAWGKFLVSYGLGMTVLSVFAALLRLSRNSPFSWRLLFGDVVLGSTVGAFLGLTLMLVVWPLGTDWAAIITFGVPALLVALVLADYAEILLLGKWLDESEREWRSRLGAFLFMIAAGWLLFFVITLYIPRGIQWSIEQLHDPRHRAAVYSAAGSLWAVISALGAWAGRWMSSRSDKQSSGLLVRLLAMIGPPVFLIGLFAAVSILVFTLPPVEYASWLDCARDPSGWAALKWSVYFGVSLLFMALFYFTVDVNLFSLHMLYANRLTRCYLGASRRKHAWRERVHGPFLDDQGVKRWSWDAGPGGAPTSADLKKVARREPTFTDFDAGDDFPLCKLELVGPTLAANGNPVEPNHGYRGPYPLLNTALNLVAGSQLALQDRKAAAFVLTPDFCGGKMTGYARLPDSEATAHNLTLGRAMAISGAAVDPNMAFFQSPPLTALMTVFNTRLGWWLQNPASYGKSWTGAGPGAGLLLLRELLGQTNEKSNYVHLSDGGHFENLGVYELIRRRCRFILVTDADTDRHAASDNLANLLRLVRTDFGIRIDVDTTPMIENEAGLSRWHCAIGFIRYEDVDPQAVSGILVYLRASMTGDEPADVCQYADTHASFPYETTLDQWYNEAQLESYRALGFHIAQEVFGAAEHDTVLGASTTVQAEIVRFFMHVRRRWFPPPPDADVSFLPAARMAVEVEKDLRSETIRDLGRELYPEVRANGIPAAQAPAAGRQVDVELHMINEMLRVMEMAWFGMKLNNYYTHPLNRGWMNLFRRWTTAASFHRYWPFLRAEYNREFVRFCERALNLVPTTVHLDKPGNDRDVVARLGIVQEMDREFRLEWTSEAERLPWLTTGRYICDSVTQAVKFAKDRHLPRPLLWLLYLQEVPAPPVHRPCGVVCVAPPYRGAGSDLEFFIWLRGPYRNLGIGRQCLEPILQEIMDTIEQAEPGSSYRLLTFFPDGSGSKADWMGAALWKNFFFDFRFRSLGVGEKGAVAGVITLMRKIPS